MKEPFDQQAITQTIAQLMTQLGENLQRPGLEETPQRAATMFCEMLEGMRYTNAEIAAQFNKCFPLEQAQGLVVVRDIHFYSFCEHHFALMYNMKATVAYLPKEKVIGLSKIARVADMVGKRFQLQERIGRDIADILQRILQTEDVMVVVEAAHSCMSARGIRAQGALTQTQALSGVFLTDAALRQEVLGKPYL